MARRSAEVSLRAFRVALAAALGFVIASFPSRTASALEPPPSPGRTKITSGIALMVSGAVVTGLGAGLYVANENADRAACVPCAKSSWIFPTVLMGIGGAMFVAGIPVFVLGQVERSRAPAAVVSVGPFGASARFTF
ncbi:hypothetical protein [Polyangium jinanense]|uniref:Transmembrane protein n=1 Tax=Polyangium jinanense TaxID=2829994 RepID=A0A9X3X8F7_9BACT|nr:hypothetical protein [Polyangium jinanense]MDC3956595.1 hypothetical protein [Polyangium jinanense]MDC3985622.1 hypothetical protein [Polyangium jinanense]